MGGAASKDFIEGGPRTAVAKELDELGGYDRPALAKNQSFTARLDWLGTQVGKASEQIEAALSKDEQAGRKELEKEAKRRQLMALRRGQGDIQMNLQYVDFYLRQKQFEKGSGNGSASILRNSHVAALASEAVQASEASSAKLETARRSAEQVATLQRLYSTKSGPGAVPVLPGPKPDAPASPPAAQTSDRVGTPKGGFGGSSKWRQSVQHAKKTAFLAVNTYVAMNAKKRSEAGRIDNFALFAEQQLGEGVHRFVEEGEKLAAAREKLPDMKAELDNLRSAMQQLAVEQQALEASVPQGEGLNGCEEEGGSGGAGSSDAEDDGDDAEEAATVAAAAAAATMRHPRQKDCLPNKPRWNYGGGGGGGFDSLSSFPRAVKPATRLRDAPSSAPPGGPAASAASPSTANSAPLPLVGGSLSSSVAPSGGGGGGGAPPPPVHAFTPTRHPLSTVAGHGGGSGGSGGAALTPTSSISSLHPQLLRQGSTGSPPCQPPPSPGTNNAVAGSSALRAGSGRGGGGRLSMTRASWSGAISQHERQLGLPGSSGSGGGGAASESMGLLAGPLSHGVLLRPSRPSAPGVLRASLPSSVVPGLRCRNENASAGGAAAAGAAGGGGGGAPMRPASPMRASLLAGPRPPSCGGSAASSMAAGPGRPSGQRASIDLQRALALATEAPSTPGEHRVGTMASRIASKIALPLRHAAAKQQLRALRDAETANVLRQQQLLAAIEENAAVLQSSSGLLNMYCNRANGRWVEQQQWTMPPVHDAALAESRRQAARYKEMVVRDLKEGRLAVQIHVDDDVFSSSRLGHLAMWAVDPWQLLALTHPARAEWTSHLVGLGLGVRQLLALATAVEAAAGAEGLGRMQVVVSCHEGQVEAVVRDLSARKMCRFDPDNVIISVQQRAPGHMYDKTNHAFLPAPSAPPRPAGSGYALLSLCWAAGCESFRLGGADLGERRPLERSAMDMFLERGVTWLTSWRLRDLVHYSPDNCLNIDQLALSYALADSVDANMSMQVDMIESLHGISRYGSGIVLSLKDRPAGHQPHATPPPPPAPPGSTVPLLRRNNCRAAAVAASAPASADDSQASLCGESVPQPPAQPHPHPQPQPPQYPQPQTPPRPVHIPPQRHHASAPPSPSPSPPTKPGFGAASHGSMDSKTGASGSGSRPSISTSWSARAGGIGGEGGPLPVCDLKWADVQTPALVSGLQQLVDAAAAQTGTPPRVAVSIKRYAYHVPSLKAILTGPGIFRPSVSVGEGGYLYVTFDASDITAQSGARCVALSYSMRTAAAAAAADASGGSSSQLLEPPLYLPPFATATAAATRVSSAGSGAATAAASNNAIAMATAQAAAAALQRGRLLTNDQDLDTLLWVMAEQDNHPAFRASVSASNTARNRVTSHAAGGMAGVTGAIAGGGGVGGVPGRLALQQQQRVAVLAVADDAACPLAVRVAMAIMKPGADCLHVLSIAKDPSAMAVAAARAVAERFESVASATLGDVKSVVQVKRQSIVEDIAAYAESVRATLLITGSMSLAAAGAQQGGGVVVTGSVALSLARDCNRPILVVKPNARLAEAAYEVGKRPCLRAAVAAETGSRPLVRFVVDHVLDGSRGDKLVLVRGKAFDKDMQELASCRRILDHLTEEAAAHRRFGSGQVVRRMVPGAFEAEVPRVADADQCQVVAVQVPECRGPLPPAVTQLLRTSRAAVLVYRTSQGRAAPAPAPVAAAPLPNGEEPPSPPPPPPAP